MEITVNGIKTNYISQGSGETVLFLHGWGANVGLFDALINFVSKRYKAVALDLPGFGGTEEPPTPWCVSDYCEFVKDFLRQIEIVPTVIICHSFGGRLAIKLSGEGILNSVRKIVFIDSAGIKPKKTAKQKFKLATYKIGKAVLSFAPIKAIFPDALEKLRKKRGSSDYQNATPLMRQVLVKVVNEDLTHLLPKVSASSLLIWGTNDTATPISDGEVFEKLIPDAGLVKIEGAGHFSYLEAPDFCQRVIGSFLKIN